MIDTTQAFFEHIAERGYEPLLHSISGTIQWKIRDAGNWFVVVKNGKLTTSGNMAQADCVCECSKEDFDRMVIGKQNPITLFMQGKMKVTGDLELVQMFQRLFPDENLSGSKQSKKESR